MSITSTQKKDTNVVEMEIAVSAEELKAAALAVYKRKAKTLNVPGFRKGKAPKSVIERMYGEGIFLEDAISDLYPKALGKAVEESDIEPVDRPHIEILSADKEKGFTFKATLTVKPQIQVGQYKGVAVNKTIYKVKDSEIDAEIDKRRERGARIISVDNRPAKMGDSVIIDFEGFVDGVPFEGGKAEGHMLDLGSKSFIAGFEEQISGRSIGEEFDINVTFPEEYHAEALKGKPAVFKIKLNEIKETQLPAIDDEFAKDVSEFDTLEEMRADIRGKLAQSKDNMSVNEMETKIIDVITAGISGEIPPVMFENKIGELVQDFDYRLRSQGMDLETYLKFAQMDMKALYDNFRPQAERNVKIRLALETIAAMESLTASPEEVDAEYIKLAETYQVDVSQVRANIHEKDVKADVACSKAIDLVRKHAVVTEVQEKDEQTEIAEAPAAKAKSAAVPKKAPGRPKKAAAEAKASKTEESE